jgi:hypothetical protein
MDCLDDVCEQIPREHTSTKPIKVAPTKTLLREYQSMVLKRNCRLQQAQAATFVLLESSAIETS